MLPGRMPPGAIGGDRRSSRSAGRRSQRPPLGHSGRQGVGLVPDDAAPSLRRSDPGSMKQSTAAHRWKLAAIRSKTWTILSLLAPVWDEYGRTTITAALTRRGVYEQQEAESEGGELA